MMKKCLVCEEVKDLSEFYLNSPKPNGKRYPRSRCKVCTSRIQNDNQKRARKALHVLEELGVTVD